MLCKAYYNAWQTTTIFSKPICILLHKIDIKSFWSCAIAQQHVQVDNSFTNYVKVLIDQYLQYRS